MTNAAWLAFMIGVYDDNHKNVEVVVSFAMWDGDDDHDDHDDDDTNDDGDDDDDDSVYPRHNYDDNYHSAGDLTFSQIYNY